MTEPVEVLVDDPADTAFQGGHIGYLWTCQTAWLTESLLS